MTGFDAAVGTGFAGTSLMGVKDADNRLKEASYINMLTGHDTTRDTFYEVKIPLTELKITRAQLESTGLEIMMGQGEFSCMDTLPNDSATSDTTKVSDSNSPLEWADIDSLSVPFARVGHLK